MSDTKRLGKVKDNKEQLVLVTVDSKWSVLKAAPKLRHNSNWTDIYIFHFRGSWEKVVRCKRFGQSHPSLVNIERLCGVNTSNNIVLVYLM